MRIVRDNCDGENYVDVLLTEDDFQQLKDYCLLSKSVEIAGQKLNIGFKIDLDEENEGW